MESRAAFLSREMGYWQVEGRLIQSDTLRHNPGSHGFWLEMTDKVSKGKSGVAVEACGIHCWLHPVYLLATGGLGSSGEVQRQI